MVDVLKTLGFEYVVANPASSFRGLHESFINYGAVRRPSGSRARTSKRPSAWRTATSPWRASRWLSSLSRRRACTPRIWASSVHSLGRTPTYPLVREHPGRRGPGGRCSTGGPTRHDGPGGNGARHAEVGRHAGVVAALRRVRRARLPHGDDGAARSLCSWSTPCCKKNQMRDRSGAAHSAACRSRARPSATRRPWRRSRSCSWPPRTRSCLAGDVARDEDGMRLLVELAETLQAPGARRRPRHAEPAPPRAAAAMCRAPT